MRSTPKTRAPRRLAVAAAALALVITGAACEPDATTPDPGPPTTTTGPTTTTTSPPTTAGSTTTRPTTTTSPTTTKLTTTTNPTTTSTSPPTTAPPSGNPGGHADVPVEARAVDTSRPTRVVGTGTPATCTSDAVVAAVEAGGIITFNCGPNPVTITMTRTAKVKNDASPDVVIDGGGKVTLSGGGSTRILYMNTCDQAQVWTTSHCQDQDTPRLIVQNLAFVDGNSTGQLEEGGGGGAIFVRGGRFKVVSSTFMRNRCDSTGPDLGGAALRVLSQYHGLPVYVTGSTFGGSSANGNTCSNGGAISSIGVSWVVLNSVMSHNTAIGNGANPARSGTPGGGSGGAIYLDGNTFALTVSGTSITDNHANEGGGAIFFVSNDRTGTMTLDQGTILARNPQDRFGTSGLPGIFILAKLWSTTGATLS